MAKIVKGKNLPEGDVTITPAAGEQFVLSDGGSYETTDSAQLANLNSEAERGFVVIEHDEPTDEARASADEDKAREKAARKRAREIEAGKSLTDLTPVPGTPQGDPDAGHARDDQEAGN